MAWAVPLLCSGCFSKLLVDWSRARVPLESRVTRVEASRVAPHVFALRVVDVAEDGRRRQRDFFWAPGVPHHWEAVEASMVLTVRWPSPADDSVDVPDPR